MVNKPSQFSSIPFPLISSAPGLINGSLSSLQIDTFPNATYPKREKPMTTQEQRKLIYVGMTRASQRLYIHAKSYDNDSFATELRNSEQEIYAAGAEALPTISR